MEYTLSNEYLTVSFSTKGGTLSSIKDQNGLEYLWQGDPAYWSGQAPVLFPICGSIRGDQAAIGEGKHTTMPRHGIVRKREFELVAKSASDIVFSITSDEEMKSLFPYDFRLFTRYTLKNHTIQVSFEIENTGNQTFPYFIGGHPGFNCPLEDGEDYSDYQLVLEKEETCTIPTPVTETGLIDMEHRTPFMEHEKSIPLSHRLFETDAIILDELQSRAISLISKKSGKGISLSYPEFPYLILWSSANHGNFVALEPWMGLSTCSDEDDVFEHKRNVQSVKKGEKRTHSFSITVLEGR